MLPRILGFPLACVLFSTTLAIADIPPEPWPQPQQSPACEATSKSTTCNHPQVDNSQPNEINYRELVEQSENYPLNAGTIPPRYEFDDIGPNAKPRAEYVKPTS